MNKSTKTDVLQNKSSIKQTFAKQMFEGNGWRLFSEPITDELWKNGNFSITGEPKKNGDFFLCITRNL